MSNSNNILFLYRTFNPRILSLYKHLFNNILRISVFGSWGNSTRLKNMEIKIEPRIWFIMVFWILLFPPNHSRKIKNHRGFSRIKQLKLFQPQLMIHYFSCLLRLYLIFFIFITFYLRHWELWMPKGWGNWADYDYLNILDLQKKLAIFEE